MGQREAVISKLIRMIYFMQGYSEYVLEGKKYKPMPGDVIFAPPGTYHKHIIDYDFPHEYYCIKFSSASIPTELATQLESMSGCYCANNPAIAALFLSLDEHLQGYIGKHSYEVLDCTVKQILYYLCAGAESREYKIDNQTIFEIISYI